MKRRQKLKRYKGLETDVDQQRAWLRRSQEAATARARESAAPARTAKRRETRTRQRGRNDAQWRAAAIAAWGEACKACGSRRHVEMDHIIERGQGGPSVVENALPMCGDFGPCRAHVRKTRNELQIRREWLHPRQIEWLAEQGHARWEPDGSVSGRFHKTFAPLGDDTEGISG